MSAKMSQLHESIDFSQFVRGHAAWSGPARPLRLQWLDRPKGPGHFAHGLHLVPKAVSISADGQLEELFMTLDCLERSHVEPRSEGTIFPNCSYLRVGA